MTVKKLIELLREYPEDYEVFVLNHDKVYTDKFHIDNPGEEGELILVGEE